MSSEDMEMFINEPVEYVLNPLDYMDSSLNPKKCMVNLIQFVCTEYYPAAKKDTTGIDRDKLIGFKKRVSKNVKPDRLIPMLNWVDNELGKET